MSAKAITFNGYNLQTTNVVCTNLQFMSVSLDNSRARRSTTDRLKFVENYISEGEIIYEGYIKGADSDACELLLDTLKSNVVTSEPAFLDIAYGGATRRYRVKADDVEVVRETPSLDVKYIRIAFEKYELLGLDTTATVLTYEDETAGTIEKEVTFGGTYEPEPVYILNFTAGDSVSNIKIFVEETNKEIEIQQAITTGDEIIVDVPNKVVTFNDTSIDTLGIFPTVRRGVNNITFTIVSSSHDVDITISYVKRYL